MQHLLLYRTLHHLSVLLRTRYIGSILAPHAFTTDYPQLRSVQDAANPLELSAERASTAAAVAGELGLGPPKPPGCVSCACP